MRKALLTLLTVLAIGTMTMAQAPAVTIHASTEKAATGEVATKPTLTESEWRWKWCRFQMKDGHRGYTDAEVKLLIRCAVKKFPVSLDTALYIANRESGFECNANNPSSSAYGIYQVVEGTWNAWHSQMSQKWWHNQWSLSHLRGNCRANVMVSIKKAHQSGWGPWGF